MRALLALTLPALMAVPVTGAMAGDSELAGGMASYFSSELAGRRTASGERCDPTQRTAAHRTAPFGSHIRVTNVANGQSVVVRVNDRGPWGRGRVIDISYAAARAIGMHRTGTARVTLALVADPSAKD